MLRPIVSEDLVGKTIKAVDATAVNVLKLVFSDDSELELWTDTAISTQYGDIAGIFVEDGNNSRVQ